MSVLGNLPLDLLPSVLSYSAATYDVAAACLVSKAFHNAAVPILYRSIRILPRTKSTRVSRLFTTLAECPRLARFLHALEVRGFQNPVRSLDLETIIPPALQNCVNLQTCAWTRYGTLKPSIIHALLQCPITELEITADTDGQYDPSELLAFCHLRSLTLILPTRSFVPILEPWTLQVPLRNLSIIGGFYKGSRFITDTVLALIAPNLTGLEHLRIVGCEKVTHIGIAAIVDSSIATIRSLDLQQLSPSFDLEALFLLLVRHPLGLPSLRHFKLSITPRSNTPLASTLPESLCTTLYSLLTFTSNQLQTFHLSASFRSSMDIIHINADALYTNFAMRFGSTLVHLAAHNLILSSPALAEICTRCVALEEFYFGFEWGNREYLGARLSCAMRLRCVHVNFPGRINPVDTASPDLRMSTFSEEEALGLVQACSWTLVRVGSNYQVWEIERVCRRDPDGQIVAKVKLVPYKGRDMPEQFLVTMG